MNASRANHQRSASEARIRTSEASQQDPKSSTSLLTRAFRRLGLGSPKGKRSRPLPTPPPLLHAAAAGYDHGPKAQARSLPPYLAHLAEPSRCPPKLPAALIGIPQPQHLHHHYHHHLYDGGRLPPAVPMGDSSLPASSSCGLPRPPHIPSSPSSQHPTSLQPGPIPIKPPSKVPYSWELVPQRIPVEEKENIPAATNNSNLDLSAEVDVGSLGTKKSSQKNQAGAAGAPVDLVTPPRKGRAKSSSPGLNTLSPSPSGFSRDVTQSPAIGQCWGIKQDGTRCLRRVKVPTSSSSSSPSKGGGVLGTRLARGASIPPRVKIGGNTKDALSIDSGSDDGDAETRFRRARSATPGQLKSNISARKDGPEEAYCFQHVAEVNKNKGFYVPQSATQNLTPRSENFIRFSDWFTTATLSDHTQALLRKHMFSAASDVDRMERGYIYIYELQDRSTDVQVCLKVGRTINVFRRIGQWRSQCQSKDPLLRGFLPSKNGNGSAQGLLSGASAAEVPGVPLSRKWERLIHLELQDIGRRVDEHCHDCGSRHQEIFLIPRQIPSSHPVRNGFDLTQAVVEKWLHFVQTLV